MNWTKKTVAALALALGVLSAPLLAPQAGVAAEYPRKPVEIICPYSAGGGQDIWLRITIKYLAKYMPEGSKFVVNNIVAGGGIAGATAISKARPDGYQLGAIVPFQLTDQFINKGTPYTEKSFYPLAFGASDGNFLITNPSTGFKTAKDVIEYAKANPGKLNFGVGGAYNNHDFFRWKIELATGIQVNRMPFNGGAPTLAAVAGGHCEVASVSISEAVAALKEGKVIALATSEDKRTPIAPEVPTMLELGYDVVQAQWRCITCPPNTPKEIKDSLIAGLAKTFADPAWEKEARDAGYNPINISGDAALKFYEEDFNNYKQLVERLGIAPK